MEQAAFSVVPLTKELFDPVVALSVYPEQQTFVASNMKSVAQAWIYREEARPFAVCAEGVPIGFLMLDWDTKERDLGIWRLMIDRSWQGKGYGRKALEWVLETARASGLFDTVNLDYVPGNAVAEKLYRSLGFQPTGEIEDGEIVMAMSL